MKHDILSMNLAELEKSITPKYRAKQVFDWLHRRRTSAFGEMDNLPKQLRQDLSERFRIPTCRPVETLTSKNDSTKKFLFALEDGVLIESVQMEYSFGRSLCISTQAGCRMGCRFCASASGGFIRNLTAGEMCAQVYAADKPSNIVLMGCGEPLDNFAQTIRFLELTDIGARHITISTCGLVPEIRKLAEMRLQINLAISLHAATDETRAKLMPIAKRYPISELLDACRFYVQETNRRLTFEYALIRGENDSPHDAAALRKLLSGLLCHVNLIPINPGGTKSFAPTHRKEAEKFAASLTRGGIPATIRRTIGSDVDAACGQLVAKKTEQAI